MIKNLTEITPGQLLGETQNMLTKGYRFVTATCVDNGENKVTITYHFDKDYVLKNFRINTKKEKELPSVSSIYFAALLVENEMKELFGVNITDIAIDFGGHLLLADGAPDMPQGMHSIVIEQRGTKNV